MNYAIYKNSRNASWQCLIDCCVTELPIRPVQIAKHYGIMCTYSDSLSCDGVISRTKDNVSIVIRKEQPRTRQRYTILHELGHYLLGHLDKEYQSEAEYAADRFAADVLMPACVLWGLQLHTANDIVRICDVSQVAAQRRADRMAVLYQRNMFLAHPLERQVYQQFQDFIYGYTNG